MRHIRDLLKSVDQRDAYEGTDCASLSFLNTVTSGNILGKVFFSSVARFIQLNKLTRDLRTIPSQT